MTPPPEILNIWYHSQNGGPRQIERISFKELDRLYELYCALKTLKAWSISGDSPTEPNFYIRIDRDSR